MLALRPLTRCLLTVAALALLAPPTRATTLVRRGLETLTAENESIVHARVLDLHSYWNADHTLILTDVHAKSLQSLKGEPAEDVRFTLLGGTVGETTLLVIGGPELAPGAEYVLFLAHADLPGAPAQWTVRDLVQGVFEVVNGRAYSQAEREVLLPDGEGATRAPGGADGLTIESLVQQIRDLR